MPEEIGAYDAKSKLPEILRRVEGGEAFVITKRGKPVAHLVPSQAKNPLKTQAAINNILNLRKPVLSDEEFNALKEDGRK